ncbi:laccase-like [Teleopsis dalmanni]|uniref:laccase-like n=1 Tax=Teleopsis dalmanni TaxID=139649 RepID=UPI0018CF81EC|nr:laccase-like [Teleopsis dalmanni]
MPIIILMTLSKTIAKSSNNSIEDVSAQTNNTNYSTETFKIINNKPNRINKVTNVQSYRNKTKITKHPGIKIEDLKDIEDLRSYGSFENHPCRRVCQENQVLNCYYRMLIHNYQRLGPECSRCPYDPLACESERCIYGDGVPTPVMAVNYMVPGPAIEICENDTVIIDVLNYLTEAHTMHWHGLHMSQTPEMDGAPFITQYPIQPGEVYRYAFKADRSGTVWYHSHTGWQRALGVAGSLVIRQTRQANRQAHLYDYDLIEHTLMIQDIVYNYDFTRITNILINGKGRNHRTNLPDNDSRHRYKRVRVTPGYRYRMRVISNGVFNCPIEFSIENHKMLMISTDGNDIDPILADSFFLSSAERFDFILDANQYASNYWIRVRGYNNCSTTNLYQGAVLHYRGAAKNEQPSNTLSANIFGRSNVSPKIIVNGIEEYISSNTTFSKHTVETQAAESEATESVNIATSALQSLEPLSWPRYTKFLTYYSSFGVFAQRNGDIAFQIDDITYLQPDVSLLQARPLYQDEAYFCNRSAMYSAGFDCVRDNCECTNVIRLPAFKPIEMVVVNYMQTTHPFHIHGFTFRLIGQAVVGNQADLRRIAELDQRGYLKRAPPDFPAAEKDTVQIPGLGYIIIRFISDNPGFWMYHCHIEQHAIQGMVAILKVGENYQIKRIPPKIRC